ncbi:hypothetical protein DHD32_22880 [Arenibacter sp. TNZ]|jgi:hypothetical protein|nr:hypothetical protein [Arenibacter sp. TNZ]
MVNQMIHNDLDKLSAGERKLFVSVCQAFGHGPRTKLKLIARPKVPFWYERVLIFLFSVQS